MTSASRKAQRLRSRGQWAIVLALIDGAACVTGAIQLWLQGAVSIRPGYPPLSGDSAVRLLLVLGLVAVFFAAIGACWIAKASRRLG